MAVLLCIERSFIVTTIPGDRESGQIILILFAIKKTKAGRRPPNKCAYSRSTRAKKREAFTTTMPT
jgi:hypothetical protein